MNDHMGSWGRSLATGLGLLACGVMIWGSSSSASAQERQPDQDTTQDELGAGPRWMEAGQGAPRMLVYPPLTVGAKPRLVVMLHGMCDSPQNECPWFAGSVSKENWLVCPQAPVGCAGGGSMWPGASSTRFSLTSHILDSAISHYPSTARDPSNNFLVGFSQGAYMAADVAMHAGSSWRGLILIGAKVKLDARKLESAGVKRVLLASGDFDMSREEMRREARRMDGQQGIRVRYESLGRVGHAFAPDMDGWMQGALAWLSAEQDQTNSGIAGGSAAR